MKTANVNGNIKKEKSRREQRKNKKKERIVSKHENVPLLKVSV
jgi:hypothetical protein